MESLAAPDFRGAPDPRKRALLEAALTVFARHGYRKTSMEDVAQTAGVSRQGLYLHFPTKEDLFRATVWHALRCSECAVLAALGDEAASLEDRLVRAFDEWVGRYVEAMGSEVEDLVHACRTLLGNVVDEANARFVEAISGALENGGLERVCAQRGVTAADIAATLRATAEGLKIFTDSRQGFVEGMRIAVRALDLRAEPGPLTLSSSSSLSSGSSGSHAVPVVASPLSADSADRGH
jgi:AcrR family transcriptional regulator